MELSLSLAEQMVRLAIEEADARYHRPICVAVCDQYGFLLAFARMDGAPVRSIEISQCKAYTAARTGVDTTAFNDRLQRENIPASFFCDQRFTGMSGGVVLKSGDRLVGGVGVSGLAPSEDEAIAKLVAASL